MDDWCRLNGQGEFDEAGRWAQSGNTIVTLLNELLSDAYFNNKLTKSTGRELFNLHYLDNILNTRKEWRNANPRDVQATLVELTSRSITAEIKKHRLELKSEIYICGGGASNKFLVKKIGEEFPSQDVKTTDSLGIHPDFVEAAAFAWLAKQRLLGAPIKLVTGGKHNQLVLGGVYST
jgi:anhydro-N-acetylmuramic acid kinase